MRRMFLMFLCTKLSFQAHVRSLSFVKHQPYKIRTARLTDIVAIDECNRSNLQENYSNDFFMHQLNQWPELSFVAENEKNELMGYALGRIEEAPTTQAVLPFMKYDQPVVFAGHVVSVALYPRYRGLGAARALMDKLHFSLAEHFHVDSVNLFCRTSNADAIKLYRDGLQYKVDRTVSGYYLDKEDAHLMSLRGLVQRWLQQQKQQRQTMSSPLQQQEDQFDERAVVSRLGIGTSRTNDQHEPQLVRDEGQLKEVLFGKNIIREETVSGRDSATSPLQRMLPARDGDETTEQLQ